MLSNIYQSFFGNKPKPLPLTGSCPPRLRRPDVRLSQNPTSLMIYGYHPFTYDTFIPGYLFLSNPSPAITRYVLGPTWRTRVVLPPSSLAAGNTPDNGCSRMNGYRFIPKPQDDGDEAQHCLRMRRCGALWADEWPLTELPFEPQEAERWIFGWPDGGGVWVFSVPEPCWRRAWDDVEDILQAQLRELENEERQAVREKMAAFKLTLKKQNDMNGFCDSLRGTGAIFCEDIKTCPEVVELGLLEATI